ISLGGGRDETDAAFRRRPNTCALVRSEEKKLVLAERASETSSELVSLQRVLGGSEKGPGIEGAIPNEFKRRAMKLVRAGLSHNAHGAGGGITVFRGEVVVLDVEFLDGIGVRKGKIGVDVSVIVVGSVELVVDGVRSNTVDVGALLARMGSSFAVDVAIAIDACDVHRSGAQEDE